MGKQLTGELVYIRFVCADPWVLLLQVDLVLIVVVWILLTFIISYFFYQDPGPQIPTPVTDLVKNGTNLLQAVGQFNGNHCTHSLCFQHSLLAWILCIKLCISLVGKYIIVVAFMSKISNPSCQVLPNYKPPVAAASDPGTLCNVW